MVQQTPSSSADKKKKKIYSGFSFAPQPRPNGPLSFFIIEYDDVHQLN